MIAVGVLFALFAPRLVAKSHEARYSFSVQQPSSGAYESIDLTATTQGRGGERAAARELQLRMFVQQSPVAGSEMTVDPAAGTFRYHAPGGGGETAGKFDADALVNWMRRFGIGGDETKLTAEANALVAFIEQVRRDPAGGLRGKTKHARRGRRAVPTLPHQPPRARPPLDHAELGLVGHPGRRLAGRPRGDPAAGAGTRLKSSSPRRHRGTEANSTPAILPGPQS